MAEPLLVISGPTAAGKSALALELAKKLDGEIISCDSVLVYRGFDIGSAKPSSAERALVPHHLIDVCEASQQYNAARFREESLICIDQIRSRGKKPILVGGTTLYISALLNGLSELPESDPALRTQLFNMNADERFLFLKEKDTVYASQIHAHDTLRIVRALEIILTTGLSLAESYKIGKKNQIHMSANIFNIAQPHELLRQRIDQRTKQMMTAGLVEEVRELQKLYPSNAAPFTSVGYAQVLKFLRGELTIEQLTEDISTATKQLAKRQRTFWRNEPAKRGWTTFPNPHTDLLKDDVIQYQDEHKAGRAKGIQRGFATYLWDAERICSEHINNSSRDHGVFVFAVQTSTL
jgi:tRNA dimethylallyltransferase